jgi:hypothetical protein
VGAGRLKLSNNNFDVGAVTHAGRYTLTDAAYAKLLHNLESHYLDMPQELRSDILAFYQDLSLPVAIKADEADWARLRRELSLLNAINHDLVAAGSEVSTASGPLVAR